MAILATILGIGLILFVHESGHFLAARAAGVRVETFSLGFGPRLIGFRKNGTDFRISIIPLGGYVKLAGEEATRPPLPDELMAASPGWRFLIFSGGILMNFLFAMILIPILFRIGVPFLAPVAGLVEPGSPAWQAGVREGERIAEVDGRSMHAFRTFGTAIALSGADEQSLLLRTEDGSERSVTVAPEFNKVVKFRLVGIGQSFHPDLTIGVAPGSTAEQAGLANGDTLVSLGGVPVRTTQEARIAFYHALWSSGPLDVEVRRDGEPIAVTLERTVPDPPPPPQIGLRQISHHVQAVREGPLEGHFLPGDAVLRVAGAPVRTDRDLAVATILHGGLPETVVRRGEREVTLPARPDVDVAELSASLWLASIEDLEVAVVPGGPAYESGLRDGDVVLRLNGDIVEEFRDFSADVRALGEGTIEILVRRRGLEDPLVFQVEPRVLVQPTFGFAPMPYEEIVRRSNFLEALRLGVAEATHMIREVFATISSMIRGDVGTENLGGIVAITEITHNFASQGMIPLLFFLAMISVHLGVLNLLPIPALDGGHLMFVIIEKLRGRPVSERTQGLLNLVGVLAVLFLIVFVTIQDIQRLTS